MSKAQHYVSQDTWKVVDTQQTYLLHGCSAHSLWVQTVVSPRVLAQPNKRLLPARPVVSERPHEQKRKTTPFTMDHTMQLFADTMGVSVESLTQDELDYVNSVVDATFNSGCSTPDVHRALDESRMDAARQASMDSELSTRIVSMKLLRVVMAQDGDCLFHAMGRVLEIDHAEARRRVCDFLCTSGAWERVSSTIDEDVSQNMYLFGIDDGGKVVARGMSEQGTWGDITAIRAFAEMADRRVHVISYAPVSDFNVGNEGSLLPCVHFAFNGYNHYDLAQPFAERADADRKDVP